MTCMEIFLNGAKIGMMKDSMHRQKQPKEILYARIVLVVSALSAAAPGAAMPGVPVLRVASGSLRSICSTTSGRA